MKQQIRIIGGRYRGKKLTFPDAPGLRPTPDRVRETLFNWLMHDIQDARCLDAFAGSGALGFEAFSRGAKRVVLLEQAPTVYRQLQQTSQAFANNALTVVAGNALDYLRESREEFDIIFLDPPFQENYLETCLQLVFQGNCLAPQGLVYVESATALMLNSKQWQTVKAQQAGQVFYALYQRASNEKNA